MIDIENQIYTALATALRAKFEGITVSGEYVKAPAAFPFVSIVEQDNYTTRSHMDSSDTERYATIMYEINIYSDRAGQKKAICKRIAKYIDEMMYKLNFRRTSLSPVPNLENATIYRFVGRYQAETDGNLIYRG